MQILINNYFQTNKESEEDEEDDLKYTLLSVYMEELLLSYYYLLSKRKVLKLNLTDFWATDTYTIYTLLDWEQKAIKHEEEEVKADRNNQGNNQGNHVPIEDDPNQTQLFKQYIEDEEDEE